MKNETRIQRLETLAQNRPQTGGADWSLITRDELEYLLHLADKAERQEALTAEELEVFSQLRALARGQIARSELALPVPA